MIALRKLGMSQAAIAERVGVSSSTVSNWLAVGAYPETTRGPYVSRIDPYLPSLFQRWESGCHTMVRLHQEIVARGYKGSYASVRDHLIRRLPGGKKNTCKGAQLSPVPLEVAAGDVSFPAPASATWIKRSEGPFFNSAKAIPNWT